MKHHILPQIPLQYLNRPMPMTPPLTETKDLSAQYAVNEELGSFTNQYEIADRCAQTLKDMYINSVAHSTVSISRDDAISSIELTITGDMTGVRITDYDYERRTAYIEVGRHVFIDYELVGKLSPIIAHELMHYNVYVKREESERENPSVDWYAKLISVMGHSYSQAYYFARMMYTTYYQEVNAFVSQTAAEIREKMRARRNIDIDEFKKLVEDTESVRNFKTNMVFYHRMKNCSDEEIESEICADLRKEGLNWNVEQVKSKMRRGYIISSEALKDCRRNAMLAFYEINRADK